QFLVLTNRVGSYETAREEARQYLIQLRQDERRARGQTKDDNAHNSENYPSHKPGWDTESISPKGSREARFRRAAAARRARTQSGALSISPGWRTNSTASKLPCKPNPSG